MAEDPGNSIWLLSIPSFAGPSCHLLGLIGDDIATPQGHKKQHTEISERILQPKPREMECCCEGTGDEWVKPQIYKMCRSVWFTKYVS